MTTPAKLRLLSRYAVLALAAFTVSIVGCSDNDDDGPTGSTVTGTVRNSSNAPIAGVVVSINTTPAKTDTTGADGIFTLTEIEAGSYTLTFSGSTIVTFTSNVTVAENDPNVTVGNLTATLTSEQTGSISGTVMADGAPVDQAEVKIVELGRVTNTNATGNYSFSDVVIGTYTVVSTKQNYLSDSAQVTVTADANSTENFTLVETAILSGSLIGTRTLKATTVYTLQGFYQITAGSKLFIPAGTRIEGEPSSAIITLRASGTGAAKASGQIIATGTEQNPIVFTSKKSAGTRARGDWGGIILNGIADLNPTSKQGVGEGNTGAYGWGGISGISAALDTDTSGVLQYVRVEFGGTKVTPDNEVNGFTFNAVGSGTVVDHIQAHFIADDGVEFFGGKVNCKYVVVSGVDDDMLDTDFGYQGKIQYFFGIQDKSLANRGMEADNDGSGSSNTPISKPTIWNFTFVGGNDVDDKNNDDNSEGMYWRRNTQYDANNGIVAYFNRYGLVFDGSNPAGGDSLNAVNQTATAKHIIMWNNMKGGSLTKHLFQAAFKSTNYDTVDLRAAIGGWNILVQDPGFTSVNTAGNANPMNGTMPDPRPTAVVTGGTPPSDGFFDVSATYIGAFNTTTNWLTNWTIWALN
jgi:hypothetical protein